MKPRRIDEKPEDEEFALYRERLARWVKILRWLRDWYTRTFS